MAKLKLKNVKVKGIVCAVPKEVTDNNDFEQIFSHDDVEKVVKMTGVQTRRISNSQTCSSDLCVVAASKLLTELSWHPESIDALIFVSQTPDHRLPATSCSVHERLAMSTDCAVFDVNLGCSGYVYGLWLAANIILSSSFKRVLLLVGDTISKVVSPYDRATTLLFGDAGSATALQFEESAPEIVFVLGTDGKGYKNLIIPSGGFRNPSSADTLDRVTMDDGILRSQEDLYMNGGEIFNFTLERVVPLINEILAFSGLTADAVDYFAFHQANEFMLKHIAKKLRLSLDKIPINIKSFGNTSSASIPLVLTSDLAAELRQAQKKVVMAGFGVGYSWGAAVIDLGPLKCNSVLEV